jgi:hypothetical protein
MKTTIHFIAALLMSFTSFSQTDSTKTDTAAKKNKMEWKLGVYYNSNLNYYGRTDSLQSSGAFVLAEWWLTKNFYVNAAPVFVNNAVQRFEYTGTVATIGYQFVHKQKFAGHIYVVKPFYKENSKLVQSALKAQVAANFTWLGKIINLNVGGDLKFSDQTDIGATAGVDRIFIVRLKKSVLVIDPSAYVYAGTQRFNQSYLQKSSGFLLFPGTEQVVTESKEAFNILSYEFAVPVIWTRNKFQLLFNPAWVVPQNLLNGEKGEPMLYCTVGGKIILK